MRRLFGTVFCILGILAIVGAALPLHTTTGTPNTCQKVGEFDLCVDHEDTFNPREMVPLGSPQAKMLARSAVNCDNRTEDSPRVQVIHLAVDGQENRYPYKAPILRIIGNGMNQKLVQASAESGGGSRHIRFVTDADCQISVGNVSAPESAHKDLVELIQVVRQAGYNDPNLVYLIFADYTYFCGIATFTKDDTTGWRNEHNYAVAYGVVGLTCTISNDSAVLDAAMHELFHELGAVQPSAPHTTGGGHCFDEQDILCYEDGTGIPMQEICPQDVGSNIDCNHDDYFNVSPTPGSYLATHWNVADSVFLFERSRQPTISLGKISRRGNRKVAVSVTGLAPSEPFALLWGTRSRTPATKGTTAASQDGTWSGKLTIPNNKNRQVNVTLRGDRGSFATAEVSAKKAKNKKHGHGGSNGKKRGKKNHGGKNRH